MSLFRENNFAPSPILRSSYLSLLRKKIGLFHFPWYLFFNAMLKVRLCAFFYFTKRHRLVTKPTSEIFVFSSVKILSFHRMASTMYFCWFFSLFTCKFIKWLFFPFVSCISDWSRASRLVINSALAIWRISQLLDRAVNPYLSKIVEFSADYAVRRQVKSCSSFAEYEIVNCKEEVA